MTNLFFKLFIKDYDPKGKNPPAVRRACGSAVAVVGIIANLFLAGVKLFAGIISGAISITADAVNNLSDAGSQVVSLISFRISAKPADRSTANRSSRSKPERFAKLHRQKFRCSNPTFLTGVK